MVFSFPQLSSGVLSSFIDTSPSVVYPASRNASGSRRRAKSLASQDVSAKDQAPVFTFPEPQSQKTSQPVKSLHVRSYSSRSLGRNALPSDIDQREQLLPDVLQDKRLSVGNPSLARPSHRRSQSAAPLPTKYLLASASLTTRRETGPQNRLQEFSRNPAASASVTSLPSLAETEQENGEDVGVSASGPVTSGKTVSIPPIIRPRQRLLKEQILIPTTSLSMPPSLKISTSENGQAWNPLVPPPQPAPAHASMPPPPLRASSGLVTHSHLKHHARPSPTRANSYRDTTTNSFSQPAHQRRASVDGVGSTEVSDIAVLATWSFPLTPSPEKKPRPASQLLSSEPASVKEAGQSSRLRERLRNLSKLDTRLEDLEGASASSTTDSGDTAVGPPNFLPPCLASHHRHTHSSPNLLLSPPEFGSPGLTTFTNSPLCPLPKYQRAPTTTQLRKPNLLSLHTGMSCLSLNNNASSTNKKGELSSSPGSMISDFTTCPSPTSSVQSLSVDPITIQLGQNEGENKWWTVPTLKRSKTNQVTVCKEISDPFNKEDMYGLDADEEDYIDMDHM
ncbi:uncharacterized protein L203_106032 [Cryptococcus depauperatus CBS 7841]|uniref:Uncharacterized protein n=1 Tax=Cryptococcus depauperatus CBS 7841 TaxID=1295531 RepID=A0A1E3IXN9_9TREE|nr:hypothetical protein L203_00738 [Cryptococcus depauperatus CBS 7841]